MAKIGGGWTRRNTAAGYGVLIRIPVAYSIAFLFSGHATAQSSGEDMAWSSQADSLSKVPSREAGESRTC